MLNSMFYLFKKIAVYLITFYTEIADILKYITVNIR